MKRLKIWFKWKYLRRQYKLDEKIYKKRNLKIDEKLIKSILVKIVSNPKNDILISPISKTIYIQTEYKDYTIVLSDEKIKVSNHNFFIETQTSYFFSRKLFKIVYHYVEKYRLEKEKEMFKNEVDGLTFMLNKLNKK